MATTEKTNVSSTETTSTPTAKSGARRIVNLVIGDTLAFIIFAIIGRSSHGESVDPGCSWPVAMALRGIFVDHGVPPVSFAIITLIFNTFVLNVWRGLYALYNGLRERRSSQTEK